MITFISAAVVFGLSAGFSPGPLLTLVIAQTLKHGVKEGVKVSLAPLVTDAPIICITLLVLSFLSHIHAVLGWISIAGGCFVVYLAFSTFRAAHPDMQTSGKQAQSLGKGIAVNALSPHPYLFWITVGSPFILRAWEKGLPSAIAFVLSFMVCLVGSKILVAILVGKTRHFLTGNIYRYTMRVLGVLLFVFALLLFRDGIAMLSPGAKFP